MDWLADGRGFIVTGRHNRTYDNKQLWLVTYPSGEVTRLTNDYNDYYGVSVNKNSDGKTAQIATIILHRTTQLWKAKLSGTSENAVELTLSGNDSLGVSWAQNGALFYGSMASGNPDIWMMDQDKNSRRQLTFDSRLDINPIATNDNRYVVFSSERDGLKSLWRMNFDGSDQIQLVQGASLEGFALTPDGQTVYYHSYFNGSGALWRVSVQGGKLEKFADGNFQTPAISPDGKFIAAAYLPKDAKEYSLAIWAINQPLSQMRVVKLLEGAKLPGFIRWSVDGQTVIYIAAKKGVGNLWAQPVDGSSARQMSHFTVNRIFSFDISPDGRSFICSRGEIAGYIVSLQLNLDKSSFPFL
ncbi:MAG: PD40 domain-containing protein [Acidobacteria bacterium]|nr:PD40 domain-containing protein [Acidobacteriota bacterium]